MVNQIAAGAEDDNDYNQDNFEDESPAHTKDLKVDMKDSEEPDDVLHEVQNYQEVVEKNREQQKTMNIQKAKIQAL